MKKRLDSRLRGNDQVQIFLDSNLNFTKASGRLKHFRRPAQLQNSKQPHHAPNTYHPSTASAVAKNTHALICTISCRARFCLRLNRRCTTKATSAIRNAMRKMRPIIIFRFPSSPQRPSERFGFQTAFAKRTHKNSGISAAAVCAHKPKPNRYSGKNFISATALLRLAVLFVLSAACCLVAEISFSAI